MATAYSACIEVGKGGVGESGASSHIVHQATGNIEKVMVVRTTSTSLCANTGAIAVLVVNGAPKAHGDVTANGSSIQANANPGDWVVVIVHTVPLFNGVACVRLGELSFRLDQCELVS